MTKKEFIKAVSLVKFTNNPPDPSNPDDDFKRGYNDGIDHMIRCIDELTVVPIEALKEIRQEIEESAKKQFQIAMGVSNLNERYTHLQMENAYNHSINIIDNHIVQYEEE